MALFRKYDFWSIMEGLDSLIDYDYTGNEKGSIYWEHYSDQIRELSIIASDMYNELEDIKTKLWYELPEKNIEFCDDDNCTMTCIAWWNTAACMFSDVDMTTLLESENRYGVDEEAEKEKRIKALERLTKKQYMMLNTLVLGFISRYLELVGAFDVITSCIRELDYHQSVIQGQNGVQLSDAVYL